MQDIKSNIKNIATIKPSQYTALTNGTTVDLQGFGSAMLSFYLWAADFTSADEIYTPKVQESDDDSNWTDVAASDLDGTLTPVTALGEEGQQDVGYKGSKRYVRGVVVTAGTTPATLASCFAVLGHPHRAPVA